jgi:hypothetical protein
MADTAALICSVTACVLFGLMTRMRSDMTGSPCWVPECVNLPKSVPPWNDGIASYPILRGTI